MNGIFLRFRVYIAGSLAQLAPVNIQSQTSTPPPPLAVAAALHGWGRLATKLNERFVTGLYRFESVRKVPLAPFYR